MSTTSALFGIAVVTTYLATIVFVAVLFSRALSRVTAHADRSHDRIVEVHKDLLDRVMAGDFAVFKSYKMAEDADQGGWEPPDNSKVYDIGADRS